MSGLGEAVDLRELCCGAFEVLIGSVQEGTDRFSLGPLYKPGEPTVDQDGYISFRIDGLGMAMAIFLERLYDRIAEMSGREDGLSLVRRFLDQTRGRRIDELADPGTLVAISDEIDALLEALHGDDCTTAAAILRQQQARHLDWFACAS